ncbi:HK97 gp10 family phage protein [Clostridium perfringens]|uniref:HK97-gp10 family putative phage morphogenesis protein n=1 Tax=Clostridium perfringens TaxID=1502 RepID=UPI001CCE5DCF|nr:HK97-gp10 family putative phage morphogenesis protein [Clostridium perfringens]UBK38680.1 HK97 gp10 family phage protein [Clostridium perfringens]UBK95516.1 HK97 gp10 family phage protein [Clostridium perfringens]
MSNEQFSESCEKAKKRMENQILKNVIKACLLIERDGKKNCPVDQGPLRAAMTHDVNIVFGQIIGRVGNTLEYAPYVHQGTGIYAKDGNGRKTPWKYKVEAGKYKGWHTTVGQKPQPFLEKAKVDNIAKIQNILGEGLK